MKKVVALFVAAGLLTACSFNVKLPPLTSQSPTESAATDLLEFAITQRNSVAEVNEFISELTYPKFALAAGDAEAGNLIVDALNESITLAVSDFKAFAEDSYDSSEPDFKSSLRVSARQTEVNEKLAMFELLSCDYLAGAAHGNCVSESFIFDTRNGTRITLIDAIDPDLEAEFFDYVTGEIFAELDSDELFSRAEVREYMSIDAFLNFWPYTDSVTIKFSPYAIAPYASGEQEIYLELEEIVSFLDITSPLYKLLT